MDFDSRVTVDVDFLLRKLPNIPEQLRAILEEIIAIDIGNNFITFEIKNVSPISVTKKYAGISASLVAHIKNTRNFSKGWQFAPHGFPINAEFLLGSKIKYFVVLSVSSCEKFLN